MEIEMFSWMGHDCWSGKNGVGDIAEVDVLNVFLVKKNFIPFFISSTTFTNILMNHKLYHNMSLTGRIQPAPYLYN